MPPLWPLLAVAASLARADTTPPRPAPAAETPPPYTDTSSVEALRNMRKIGARDPAKLSDAEAVEWVRSRFAWIALLRLEGKDKEALGVFEGCRSYCGRWGPGAEWSAIRKWGCGRRPKSGPCR